MARRTTDAILDLRSKVDVLIDEVRALRAVVQRPATSARVASPSAPNALRLERFLRELARAIGTEIIFSSADLLARALSDEALNAALQAVVGKYNVSTPKRLGKRLAAIADKEQDGLIIERAHRVREGILWKVIRH